MPVGLQEGFLMHVLGVLLVAQHMQRQAQHGLVVPSHQRVERRPVAVLGLPDQVVVFGPLLFPIAKQMGVDDVHYSMVVILAMGIGLFAPPFGVGYYAACAISRIHPDEGIKPMLGYMLALLIGTIVIAAVPWISIGLLH